MVDHRRKKNLCLRKQIQKCFTNSMKKSNQIIIIMIILIIITIIIIKHYISSLFEKHRMC
jgi:hypothetical protein